MWFMMNEKTTPNLDVIFQRLSLEKGLIESIWLESLVWFFVLNNTDFVFHIPESSEGCESTLFSVKANSWMCEVSVGFAFLTLTIMRR
jgi:hypothetical protein